MTESQRTFVRRTLSLAVCALVSSCLVTNELDFVENVYPARALKDAITPANGSRVPSAPDAECTGMAPSMYFGAHLYDLDLEQDLYGQMFVNGVAGIFLRIKPKADTAPNRQTRDIPVTVLCVPLASLNRRCNHVQLFTTDNVDVVANPASLAMPDNPESSMVEWFILGGPADTLGGGGQPDAEGTDCFVEFGGS